MEKSWRKSWKTSWKIMEESWKNHGTCVEVELWYPENNHWRWGKNSHGPVLGSDREFQHVSAFRLWVPAHNSSCLSGRSYAQFLHWYPTHNSIEIWMTMVKSIEHLESGLQLQSSYMCPPGMLSFLEKSVHFGIEIWIPQGDVIEKSSSQDTFISGCFFVREKRHPAKLEAFPIFFGCPI